MLSIEIITTSYAKKFMKRLKSYVVREPYSVDVKFTNLAKTSFPGGQVTLLVAWPNGQGVTLDVIIPKLQPNEWRVVKLDKTEALAEGFGLFLCKEWKANDGQSIRLFDAQGRLVDSKVAVHSIPVKTWEEIYSFWALLVAAASLVIIVVDILVKYSIILFQWLN
jgi:hypothetical protein